ncbi:SIMPL domain-containing protein [Cognatishimia sp. WU-CL00825]|uniref:SIMPL domain-containing protein n=1 Tax=Cognatishimia sp. WU-CL00825 TaxID=3127658 RepID=UPI003103A712
MRFVQKMVLVVGLMLPAVAQAGQIVVQGRGTVEQTPDMAIISLGARFQAHTAREALDEVNKRTKAALDIMTDMGVAPRDMQTGNLQLNPLWDHGANHNEVARIRGYEARNQVTIRVRDLTLLGNSLDQIVTKGANVFNGLSFAMQDPSVALAEARKQAVLDARDKAALYAEAAGVDLGAIISIDEGVRIAPQPRFAARAEMAMDSAVPIAAGELSTSATVTIVYEIAQ